MKFSPRFTFSLALGVALLSTNLLFSASNQKETKTPQKAPSAAATAAGREPLIPHDKFAKDCGACHLPNRWDAMKPEFKFNHLKETGFALLGVHKRLACTTCHNGNFPNREARSRGCAACHEDRHKGTLGPDCRRCHNVDSWKPSSPIVRHAESRFPLTGVHQTLLCEQCHAGAPTGDFKGAPVECYPCHVADYQRAPDHVANNFPCDCAQCHTTTSWVAPWFNHDALGAAANCYACHSAEYATQPDHVALHYPHTCGQCHATATWVGARVDHSIFTTSTDCTYCHMDDYQSAPDHVAQNYPRTCLLCHNTTTWLGARVDHSGFTTGTDCYGCHAEDYARGDNHLSLNYHHTCLECHTVSSWIPSTFRHDNVINEDEHSGLACTACHRSGSAYTWSCTGTECHESTPNY